MRKVITKKSILSLVLALCLLFGMAVNTFAATCTTTLDKTSIKAGETVTVTLTLDEPMEKIMTVGWFLYYDPELVTPTSWTSASSENGKYITMSTRVFEDDYGTYAALTTMDTTSKGVTLDAGELCTVTFTAKEDITESKLTSFQVRYDSSVTPPFEVDTTSHSGGPAVSLTINPASDDSTTTYNVTMSEDKTVVVGEDAQVKIGVTSETETTYAAYKYVLTYNTEKLTYKSVKTSTTSNASAVEDNGTITITGFGADQTCGTDDIILTFTARAVGDGNVTMTSANVDKASGASSQDTPAATLIDDTTVIHVTDYTVTLSENFTGAETVAPGADYTFTAKDKNYDYEITATMGGAETAVTDNGDGTYTIPNVSGNLVITDKKTPKQYDVTVEGTGKADVTAETKATYGTDYTFSVNKEEGYTYEVAVTVDGKNYNAVQNENGTYTIEGKNITGAITISVTKDVIPPTTTEISFTGNGSDAVVGGTSQTANNDEDFTFYVTEESGYSYTVKLGDTEMTATGSSQGRTSYVIPSAQLDGTALTVTVEKEKIRDLDVDVAEYLKLDGTSLWLVTAKETLNSGEVLSYDGTPMFTSEKYDAYAYLVISDKTLDEVKAAALEAIAPATATSTTVSYDGDVNGTAKIDINDAQLVWNMYNLVYSDFSKATMEQFLRADMNGDKTVSVLDATAVVAKIQ